jgi:dipeptidyl aminopeptidase/acylaminoacyl peptidase
MAQAFDVDRLETEGEAVPLAEGVPAFTNPSRIAGFAVSPGGLLVYLAGLSRGQSRLVWRDRQGKVLDNLGEPTFLIASIALSPDGKRVAADISDRSGNEDIWIYDTARGIPTRFTFDPKRDREPVWSPDGNTLYFSSDRKGVLDLFRKASNGTGNEELLLGDSATKVPGSVSPDGKLMLYRRDGEKTLADLWVLPLTQPQGGGKPEPRIFLQTHFNELRPQFSPEGQWVVYQSQESGQYQVYAAPFTGTGRQAPNILRRGRQSTLAEGRQGDLLRHQRRANDGR